MYLLITRNNPYLEELNKNPQSQAFQKDLDGMEIDLKNRLKVQEMDMKDCYDLDKDSDENSPDYTICDRAGQEFCQKSRRL